MVDRSVEEILNSTKLDLWKAILLNNELSTNHLVVSSVFDPLRKENQRIVTLQSNKYYADTDNLDKLEIVQESSTPNLDNDTFSTVDTKSFISEELYLKEIQYKQTVQKVESELLIALYDYTIESDSISYAESLICKYSKKYSLRLVGEALTDIYIKNFDQPKIIAGICSSLERFDSTEVAPWGQSIVIGLINHNSDFVKERVISLIDNWGDLTLLTALKSIEIKSLWMQEYVNDVIKSLEEKQCII